MPGYELPVFFENRSEATEFYTVNNLFFFLNFYLFFQDSEINPFSVQLILVLVLGIYFQNKIIDYIGSQIGKSPANIFGSPEYE